MVSASTVSLFVLALLLLNPLALAQWTAFRPAKTTMTTETETLTEPITTIFGPTATITTATTETQTEASPTTYTTTITTLTTNTEKTTFTISSTTTETTTITSPTATITTATTLTQTKTSSRTYTTTITTSTTKTAKTAITTSMITILYTRTTTITYQTANVTLTISCNHAPVAVGATVTCKEFVFGSGSPPTGNVRWYGNSSVIFSSNAACTLRPAPEQLPYSACSVKFTPTAVGSVILSGDYRGDMKYAPSNGTSRLNVTMRVPKTTVSCKPTSAAAGSSTVITCMAKVTGYKPNGTVSWSQSGTGSVALSSTACTLKSLKNPDQATCSVTMTGATAGNVKLQGTYSGDSNNQASNRTAKLTIK